MPTSPVVIVVEDNLFLRAKIEGALKADGYAPRVVADEHALDAALAEAPILVLVNLAARAPWERLVERVREIVVAPVVGYGPHTDEELLARGRAAGCDDVVANGLVAGNPGHLVVRYVRSR